MGIKEDAGHLLLHIYIMKIRGKQVPQTEDFLKITQWEKYRLDNALGYCLDGNFLDISCRTMVDGRNKIWLIKGITKWGVDVIEDTKSDDGKVNFNVYFNLTINNEFNIDSIIKGEAKLFG